MSGTSTGSTREITHDDRNNNEIRRTTRQNANRHIVAIMIVAFEAGNAV